MSTERYAQTAWSLADLLPATSGEKFDQMLVDLEASVTEMESWRERLSPDISEDDFIGLIKLYETITEFRRRMVGYGQLWFAADTQSQDALGFMGRMKQLFAEVQNRLLFWPRPDVLIFF